jgi:hypothetical protein
MEERFSHTLRANSVGMLAIERTGGAASDRARRLVADDRSAHLAVAQASDR